MPDSYTTKPDKVSRLSNRHAELENMLAWCYTAPIIRT